MSDEYNPNYIGCQYCRKEITEDDPHVDKIGSGFIHGNCTHAQTELRLAASGSQIAAYKSAYELVTQYAKRLEIWIEKKGILADAEHPIWAKVDKLIGDAMKEEALPAEGFAR